MKHFSFFMLIFLGSCCPCEASETLDTILSKAAELSRKQFAPNGSSPRFFRVVARSNLRFGSVLREESIARLIGFSGESFVHASQSNVTGADEIITINLSNKDYAASIACKPKPSLKSFDSFETLKGHNYKVGELLGIGSKTEYTQAVVKDSLGLTSYLAFHDHVGKWKESGGIGSYTAPTVDQRFHIIVLSNWMGAKNPCTYKFDSESLKVVAIETTNEKSSKVECVISKYYDLGGVPFPQQFKTTSISSALTSISNVEWVESDEKAIGFSATQATLPDYGIPSPVFPPAKTSRLLLIALIVIVCIFAIGCLFFLWRRFA